MAHEQNTFEAENRMTPSVYSMTSVAPTVSAVLGIPAPSGAIGKPIEAIVSALSHRDRVAIVAPDALGMFAWNLWKQEMPFLNSLHARHSIVLKSVLPSITPVNFACMVTGTDRDGHGIHSFRHDFACQTIFDVIRETGGTSAGVGFDGYTGSELLGRFADIRGNVPHGSDDAIAERVIAIARERSPQFIIAQLGRVDDVFHEHGPSSPEVAPMLRETDAYIRRIVEKIQPLGYGVIILSDHGQHDVIDPLPEQHKGNHGGESDEDCLVPCTWV